MQITLNVNEIKIPDAYAETIPKRSKLNNHMKYYLEYGTFKHNIVVTQRNTLVDGLCSYIIAVVCGMDTVQCEVNTKPLKGKTGKRRKICSPNRKRKILFEQQNGKCALCSAELQIDDYTSIDDYMNLDHIFPVCRGGSNGLSNLQGLCRDCNFQKKDNLIMKRKVYETGSVSTLHEMQIFFAVIRELFPVIDIFICTHEMVNSAITDNECYSIRFGTRKTVLYLKQS